MSLDYWNEHFQTSKGLNLNETRSRSNESHIKNSAMRTIVLKRTGITPKFQQKFGIAIANIDA
jgi:hypothetical protein